VSWAPLFKLNSNRKDNINANIISLSETVRGNVPCKTAVPAPIPPATNCDISKAPCGKADNKAKNLIGLSKTFTPSPALFKTDTKGELQKETSLKIKGWDCVPTIINIFDCYTPPSFCYFCLNLKPVYTFIQFICYKT
jgi:hypothetical protein